MAYFSFRAKVDFENLLILEKTAWKPSTRTKYFSFAHFQLNCWQVLGGVENFQNFSKFGDANKLKWVEKSENLTIDPPTIWDWRVEKNRLIALTAESCYEVVLFLKKTETNNHNN